MQILEYFEVELAERKRPSFRKHMETLIKILRGTYIPPHNLPNLLVQFNNSEGL